MEAKRKQAFPLLTLAVNLLRQAMSRHCNNQDKLLNSCQRPRLGTEFQGQSLHQNGI